MSLRICCNHILYRIREWAVALSHDTTRPTLSTWRSCAIQSIADNLIQIRCCSYGVRHQPNPLQSLDLFIGIYSAQVLNISVASHASNDICSGHKLCTTIQPCITPFCNISSELSIPIIDEISNRCCEQMI